MAAEWEASPSASSRAASASSPAAWASSRRSWEGRPRRAQVRPRSQPGRPPLRARLPQPLAARFSTARLCNCFATESGAVCNAAVERKKGACTRPLARLDAVLPERRTLESCGRLLTAELHLPRDPGLIGGGPVAVQSLPFRSGFERFRTARFPRGYRISAQPGGAVSDSQAEGRGFDPRRPLLRIKQRPQMPAVRAMAVGDRGARMVAAVRQWRRDGASPERQRPRRDLLRGVCTPRGEEKIGGDSGAHPRLRPGRHPSTLTTSSNRYEIRLRGRANNDPKCGRFAPELRPIGLHEFRHSYVSLSTTRASRTNGRRLLRPQQRL